MLGITARQSMCSPLKDGAGMDWVEIFIPPEQPGEYYGTWPRMSWPGFCYMSSIPGRAPRRAGIGTYPGFVLISRGPA